MAAWAMWQSSLEESFAYAVGQWGLQLALCVTSSINGSIIVIMIVIIINQSLSMIMIDCRHHHRHQQHQRQEQEQQQQQQHDKCDLGLAAPEAPALGAVLRHASAQTPPTAVGHATCQGVRALGLLLPEHQEAGLHPA